MKKPIVLRDHAIGYLDKGQIFELPSPPAENKGLIAALDLGGRVADQAFTYGVNEDQAFEDEHFKLLLVVDLENEFGMHWVEGCDVPEGAKIAIIDPKYLVVDENNRVAKGVHFLRRGEGWVIGKNIQSVRNKMYIEHAAAVSDRHLEIGVTKKGKVLLKDLESKYGTIVSTGEHARGGVGAIGEEFEHHIRFKEIIGAEAVDAAGVDV